MKDRSDCICECHHYGAEYLHETPCCLSDGGISMYNLNEERRYFNNSRAYLARDMRFDPEHIPVFYRNKVEQWRESVMRICSQHERTHEEIARQRDLIEKLLIALKVTHNGYEEATGHRLKQVDEIVKKAEAIQE